jgi:hypothetical protein
MRCFRVHDTHTLPQMGHLHFVPVLVTPHSMHSVPGMFVEKLHAATFAMFKVQGFRRLRSVPTFAAPLWICTRSNCTHFQLQISPSFLEIGRMVILTAAPVELG